MLCYLSFNFSESIICDGDFEEIGGFEVIFFGENCNLDLEFSINSVLKAWTEAWNPRATYFVLG